ncbi:MAG: DHA2 family efflux MFS transporter permease subunit [Ktedonobacterales bacterium]
MRLAYKWRVLISVIFGLFMVILDSTVVNVALQTLRDEFKAGLDTTQWVISIYVLALGIATPLSAFLADRFGVKRTYVTGLALFVIGSFICGVAPTSTIGVLVAARALQGLGGGLALPLGTALLFSAFTVKEQGVAFGVFGVALVMAPALGPILGGLLVDHGLWRWIFFLNVPIGALGVTLASLWLHEHKSEVKPRFDIPGFITSTIGFGAVLYAASIASDIGWTSPRVLTFFAIGVVSLAAFTLIELFVAKEPLLNLRLLRRPVFTLAIIVGWVSVLALFGAEFLLPLYLQELRGKTAFETGLILLPLAISSGIVAPFAGRLYDRWGARPLMIVGFGLLAINTWQLALITGDTPISWLIILLIIRGLALGFMVQTTLVAALSDVPGREVARASSLSNATRQVVQSIGVAVLATVLIATLSPQVKAIQSQLQNTSSSRSSSSFFSEKGLCGITPPAIPVSGGSGQRFPGQPGASGPPAGAPDFALIRQACDQSVQGFQNAYTLTFFFALLALILGALLPGWPLKWTGRKGPGNISAEAGDAEATVGTPVGVH